MRYTEGVHSTAETVKLFEKNHNTVYVRSNVKQVEIEAIPEWTDGEGVLHPAEKMTVWQYDEKQYDIDEYIEEIGQENKSLKSRLTASENMILQLMTEGSM